MNKLLRYKQNKKNSSGWSAGWLQYCESASYHTAKHHLVVDYFSITAHPQVFYSLLHVGILTFIHSGSYICELLTVYY